MRVHPTPYAKIANGSKTLEMRVNDPKRRRIRVGDTIEFINADDPRLCALVTVLTLHPFESFDTLLSHFSATEFGGDSKENLLSEVRRLYTPEEESGHGVVGIRFRLESETFTFGTEVITLV